MFALSLLCTGTAPRKRPKLSPENRNHILPLREKSGGHSVSLMEPSMVVTFTAEQLLECLPLLFQHLAIQKLTPFNICTGLHAIQVRKMRFVSMRRPRWASSNFRALASKTDVQVDGKESMTVVFEI